MKNIFLIIFLYLLLPCMALAQGKNAATNMVTNSADSTRPSLSRQLPKIKIAKPAILKKDFWQNRPRTATILSLALPGAGQVYNGKWWKVPIVYGLIGGMAYLYKNNIDEYEKYRQEYIHRDKTNQPQNPELAILNTEAIALYRDQYLSNAELAGLGVILSYLVNAGDAFVDAHLQSFEINDDLSFKITPKVQTSFNQPPAFGVGLAFSFK